MQKLDESFHEADFLTKRGKSDETFLLWRCVLRVRSFFAQRREAKTYWAIAAYPASKCFSLKAASVAGAFGQDNYAWVITLESICQYLYWAIAAATKQQFESCWAQQFVVSLFKIPCCLMHCFMSCLNCCTKTSKYLGIAYQFGVAPI